MSKLRHASLKQMITCFDCSGLDLRERLKFGSLPDLFVYGVKDKSRNVFGPIVKGWRNPTVSLAITAHLNSFFNPLVLPDTLNKPKYCKHFRVKGNSEPP